MFPALNWDGSDIGDISAYYVDITAPKLNTAGAKLTLINGRTRIRCLAWKYENDVPLIIDELKPLFGLTKIGRHKCVLFEVKLLIAKIVHSDENVLEEHHHSSLSDQYLDTVEEIIVFRYITGLSTRGEFLWYRDGEVLSYKDTRITFSREVSNISERNIKTWFLGDRTRVCLAMKRLLENSPLAAKATSSPTIRSRLGRIVQLLRVELLAKIRRLNDDLVSIVIGIISRIQFLIGDLELVEAS